MDKDALLELIDAYSEQRALIAANEALERCGYHVATDVRDRDTAYAKMAAYIGAAVFGAG